MSFYIAIVASFFSIKEVGDKKGVRIFYSTHEKEKSRFFYKSRLSNDFSFSNYKN